MEALEPLLYSLGVVAACVALPVVAYGVYQFVVNAIFDAVMPNLLLAPDSYPATAVAWIMLLGFVGLFVAIFLAVAL